eukprot:CAMPEP_0206235584 /NCGR_PEP_ID=MMETSP0047_2-20121206/13232_1 /ASSEMBLY_ACC=CAM_ASM_000192 /TAXON_ID=195065 /ORGANISM="Chroomonas mesostigmatica_cf, Strain CCMP1168" /LENGTH=297 /DNA_ID=CAMNT_0053659807 /DNA_START=131 /DNA_END=1021 /DNA_ORIENTATION=-
MPPPPSSSPIVPRRHEDDEHKRKSLFDKGLERATSFRLERMEMPWTPHKKSRFRICGRGGVVLLVFISLPALILFTISRHPGAKISRKRDTSEDDAKKSEPVLPNGVLAHKAGSERDFADVLAGVPTSIYDFDVTQADGTDVSLETFTGRVVLIVNVATYCGYAEVNYRELQRLQNELDNRYFSVIAFPCNQFGGQEPGSMGEILELAHKNYEASFPIMDKIEVNGPNTHPLFAYLKQEFEMITIPWNFQKFLVDSRGLPVKQYPSQVDPYNIKPVIVKLIQEAREFERREAARKAE